jgi:hypothetical protein
MRRTVRLATALIAAAALLALPAPATGEEVPELLVLEAAIDATVAAAAGGIDVVQTARYSGRTRLADSKPRIYATVPAGTRLRTHTTAAADGSGYTSVRFQPSGRRLAAGGVDPSTRESWATLLLLYPAERTTARAAGLRDRTALVGIDPENVLDYWIARAPKSTALGLLFPPYATSGDEGWTTIDVLPQADGTTVVRGTIRDRVAASDGEERCTRPLVEVTVGTDGVITSSRWITQCPGRGTTRVDSVATYGPQVPQPPTRPRAPASVLD